MNKIKSESFDIILKEKYNITWHEVYKYDTNDDGIKIPNTGKLYTGFYGYGDTDTDIWDVNRVNNYELIGILEDILNKYYSYIITYNPHKQYYETIKDYLDDEYKDYMESWDTLYEIIVYENTPIVYSIIFSNTKLNALIKLIEKLM